MSRVKKQAERNRRGSRDDQ